MTIKINLVIFGVEVKISFGRKGDFWNLLKLFNIYTDCDNDTLIFEVELQGSAACILALEVVFLKDRRMSEIIAYKDQNNEYFDLK